MKPLFDSKARALFLFGLRSAPFKTSLLMNLPVGYSHALPQSIFVGESYILLEIKRYRHIDDLAEVTKDIRAWRASR